jgi:tetratricopeptide (TPR) repeat protein
LGAVSVTAAQLAAPQVTEKILILQLQVTNPGDSAASIQTMDVARERLTSLARYKVFTVPKTKICEVLKQSGFPCDGMISEQQASQIARAFSLNNYNTGQLTHANGLYVASIRIFSGASGFASTFTVNGGATPQVLGEAIAQKLNNIVKAAEPARNCEEQRTRSQFDRALAEARKALVIEPNLPAANLCIATIFEVQHGPVDSIVAYDRRALKGDPGNPTAWNQMASKLMQKGDSLGAIDTYDSLLSYNKGDENLRMQLAQLMIQGRRYERAAELLRIGLELNPSNQRMRDLRKRACVEGNLYKCVLEILHQEVEADSTKLRDTTELKQAIANAQAAPDTQDFLWWTTAATKRYPTNAPFLKLLAAALDMAGKTDSAVIILKAVVAANPNDVQSSLLIAKTLVDHAVWDTAQARILGQRTPPDTAGLRRLRDAFASKLDPAWPYLKAGFASPDSGNRFAATLIAYTGGSKLAQAQAWDKGFDWLDPTLQALAPRTPADTVGSRQQIRVLTAFWFSLSSAYSLATPLQQWGGTKKCEGAPQLWDRIQRTKAALQVGGRISPSAAMQAGQFVDRLENYMVQARKAFKCKNY